MKNWKTLLINSTTTMTDAIEILNKGAQRIAIVVDEECHLLGTVTDGDIRRALINHSAMDVPVANIMCHTPKKADVSWSKQRVLATMDQYQLLQLPIVDNQERVIGLHTLHDILSNRQQSNSVFLMAGGFGSRLHPLTQSCPKPLLKVGNKPILEIILERFIESGFHCFYISTHYMHDMIEAYFGDGSRWGVTIQYIYEDIPLGTAGALGLLPPDAIQQPMIVMNADLLTHLNFESLLAFHQKHPSVATICVREYEHCVPFGVIQSNEHHVLSMVEKPVHRFFINAGIYLVSPELVKTVKPRTNIDMPTLLQQQIHLGQSVNMFPIHEYWLDIGRMEDFQLAQNEYVLP